MDRATANTNARRTPCLCNRDHNARGIDRDHAQCRTMCDDPRRDCEWYWCFRRELVLEFTPELLRFLSKCVAFKLHRHTALHTSACHLGVQVFVKLNDTVVAATAGQHCAIVKGSRWTTLGRPASTHFNPRDNTTSVSGSGRRSPIIASASIFLGEHYRLANPPRRRNQPLHVSMPLELKSSPNTSLTHHGPHTCRRA